MTFTINVLTFIIIYRQFSGNMFKCLLIVITVLKKLGMIKGRKIDMYEYWLTYNVRYYII